MKIEILTIFPYIFESFLSTSLVKKAIDRNLCSITTTQIRNFAEPPHHKVDDTPYGGGAGMTMKPEPLFKAVQSAKQKDPNAKVILMSPRGEKFTQKKAKELSNFSELIFVCGRYEGVDQRFIDLCVDEELSIGDFILMGGEVASMAIIESTLRLIPNIIGNSQSTEEESFSSDNPLLEYPQYTRPQEFMGITVPDVLLSGDHQKIAAWRDKKRQNLTSHRRPDLTKPNIIPESNIIPDLSVVLLHDDMLNKRGERVTTSLTMIDTHDFARSSKTYGVENVYISHSSSSLRRLARNLKSHWEDGFGSTYNPNRKEALEHVQIVSTLDEAISMIESRTGILPKLIATSASRGPDRVSYEYIREMIHLNHPQPYLVLFGTGWGMIDELIARCDYFLNPLEGPGEYNHLSVRSACAIILDRLMGKKD